MSFLHKKTDVISISNHIATHNLNFFFLTFNYLKLALKIFLKVGMTSSYFVIKTITFTGGCQIYTRQQNCSRAQNCVKIVLHEDYLHKAINCT